MTYKRSEPLVRWRGQRAATVGVLAAGHAEIGRVSGPGRPLDLSKPLAHAYVITMLSEFQGFVRDLHDLAVERLVAASNAGGVYTPLLIDGMTGGRGIDRGNATHAAVKNDFGRVGLSPFEIGSHNARWSNGDKAEFDRLIRLRNVLGHGNDGELRRLLAGGQVRDTVSWARRRLPVLNRYASALDHLVWDHLRRVTGKDPWA